PGAVLSDGTALGLATYRPAETEWKDFPILRYDLANGIVTKELMRVDRTPTVALRDKDRIVSTVVHPLPDAPLVAYSADGSRVVLVDRSVGETPESTPTGPTPTLAASNPGEVNVVVLSAVGDTIWARSYPYEAVPLSPTAADSLLAPRLESFLQFTGM